MERYKSLGDTGKGKVQALCATWSLAKTWTDDASGHRTTVEHASMVAPGGEASEKGRQTRATM